MKVINQTSGDGWTLYHADTVEVARGLPPDSVGFSVFSPPFADLYTYSDDPLDMGNSRGGEEFFAHYDYLIREQARVMMPGRLIAIHCMQIPILKGREGYIGVRDFRGDLIRAYQKHGFIYHSEITIRKDPVAAMQRTHALGLLHATVKRDSALCRQGFADYVVVMLKPGKNPIPISHTDDELAYTVDGKPVYWQKYADPVWDDINPSDTLQFRSKKLKARAEEDEKHICLAEGSLVLTREHGYRPIELVEIEDHVLTHRGRWMPVLNKQCNGIADTIRVRAQGVADLVATPDHRLYLRQGHGVYAKKMAMSADPEWIEARETLGSYVNLQLPPVEENTLTEEEWWIIGRWLGDGHRGTRRTSGARGAGFGEFIISCGHHEAADLISRLGPHAGQVIERTAKQITLVGLRHEVRETLSRCGEGAANKRLPGEAPTLCREKAEALLQGYLSADGHFVEKHDRCCASSISRALLLGMSLVAMRARGVVASVYAGRPEREGVICGREVHMSQDWIFSFRNSDGYHKSGWIGDDGSWRKVRGLDECGPRRVWDLQVAEDESFTAEGCIVHNCPLQLTVIRRCVRLWSAPSDVVWSPFTGIGSEGYVAVQEGRKFIGAELKQSYYDQAAINIASAEPNGKGSQVRLWETIQTEAQQSC